MKFILLLEACKELIYAIDYKPGDDLGQLAFANAIIKIRNIINNAHV